MNTSHQSPHARAKGRASTGLASAALLTLALSFGTISGAQSADAATWVSNPGFNSNASGWSASPNAKIYRSGYTGILKAKATTRSYQKTSVYSSLSSTRVAKADTLVEASARVRASEGSRNVYFLVQEFRAGKLVQSQWTANTTNSPWRSVTAKMKTKYADSQVRIGFEVSSIRNDKYLQFDNANVTKVTPPAVVTPPPVVNPPVVNPPVTPPVVAPPATQEGNLTLGNGLLKDWNESKVWALNNKSDFRWNVINDKIASQPDATWVLGDDSGVRNLNNNVTRSKAQGRTGVVVLYNIPKRNDGLSGPQGAASEAAYKTWVDGIAAATGDARTLFVVEPDALWFVDRQTPRGTAAYTERINSMKYAVEKLSALPNARVYIEAGTSSRSITPDRMAELLKIVGASNKVGYAVNVSSFGPEKEITAWATEIRDGLKARGVTNPRYVVDTGRNGNPSWPAPHEWCNPAGRKIGFNPGLVNSTSGRDANLWIKGVGTSDGSCGVGQGVSGGTFMPQVAYDMAK